MSEDCAINCRTASTPPSECVCVCGGRNHGKLLGATGLEVALATTVHATRPSIERNRASEESAKIAERAVMDVLGADADRVHISLGSAKTRRGKTVRGARAIYQGGVTLPGGGDRAYVEKPRIAVGAWANNPGKADAAGREEAELYARQRARKLERDRQRIAEVEQRGGPHAQYHADRAREGLQNTEAMTRWSSVSRNDGALRAAVLHEAGHALYDFRGLKGAWTDAVRDIPATERRRVSEYAMTNTEELFAETTAFVHMGDTDHIPPTILSAYRRVTGAR